ncbi:MAG: TetR/AcrR family transcriptional regulator [Bacteroidota bacterium]
MKSEKAKKRGRGRPSAKDQIDLTKILDIATQHFATHGFNGTQLNAIAQEAGYSKYLMNYHFGNKEKLWKRAVEHLASKLVTKYEEAQSFLKDLEGIAALKAYLRQFIYFCAAHPEFHQIVFHEMCTKTERLNWLIENVLSFLYAQVKWENTEIIDGRRYFNGIPLANLYTICIGAANTYFIHDVEMQTIFNVNPREPKEIERHADIIIDLLFAKFSTSNDA